MLPIPGSPRSTRIRRPLAAGLAGFVTLVVALACGNPSSEQSATHARVRVPLASDPLTTALLNTSDTYSNYLGLLVSDALVRYDEDLRLVPRVAESWTLSDDHATLTFVLRPDVRWHDGTAVTASDVVFSFERIRDPASGDRNLPDAFAGVRVHAADERTVVARYDQPDADLLDSWTFPLIPEHLAAADEDLLQGSFASSPVGCGPFRFVRYDRGNEIVIEADPDHWAGRPGIDRLVFKVVRDQRTALQALLTGELDMMAMTPALYREATASERGDALQAVVYPRMSAWYLAYDLKTPALADARVRRALVHLLDRESFIREVLDGLGAPGVTTWHPDSPWADPDLTPLAFDPELAADLLSEAGWRDSDGDGVRDRDGRPLQLEFLYTRGGQAILDQFAAWYQQSLGDAGVEVRLEALEFQSMRARRDEGAFDVVMGSFGLDPTGDQSELYHSSSIENGFNFFGWNDADTDALLDEARVMFDEAPRRALYSRLQRRLRDEAPLVALFYLQTPLLHRSELRDVRPTALGLYRTVPGPAAWRFEPSEPAGH